MNWLEAAARWYAVLAMLTWAFAPALGWLCGGLVDRGMSIVRPVALLGAIYPAWLLSSTLHTEYGLMPVAATAFVVGLPAWLSGWKRGTIDRRWILRLIVIEGFSLLLFVLYLWLRGFTPQILGTEKPMDVAFLASSARATVMPPPDPWFAGQPINYYYLGYLLFGMVARFSGVPPEIAFNLALATIFSMATVAAFGVSWDAIKPWLGTRAAVAGGLLAAFALVIAGNLYAPYRLMSDAPATIAASWWDSAVGIGWRSSRIVCDGLRVGNLCPSPATETINEFPYFSLLLGDLHPHLMALPYTVVAIALALNLFYLAGSSENARNRAEWWAAIAMTGIVVGGLYLLNAWDYPTGLLIVAIGLWAGAGRSLSASWKPVVVLMVISILAWVPYWLTYVPPIQGAVQLNTGLLARIPLFAKVASTLALNSIDYTSIGEYLTIFGVGYVFAVLLTVAGASSGREAQKRDMLRTALYASAVTVPFAVILGSPVIPLCGVPLALAIDELRRRHPPALRAMALMLFSVAWVISIGVELVFVRDVFNDRMNTLFKFYFQTWTLYAIGTAIAVVWLWNMTRRTFWQRAALGTLCCLAILAGFSYPAVATYQWTDHFASWQGLDGLAYASADEANDVAAIRWLRQHAQPGDVVLEAAGCSYRPFNQLPYNRVSAFSGVPTVIGWGDNHQRQWRSGEPQLVESIPQRQADVAAMYADPESPLFQSYAINWLFVGEYEAGNRDPDCRTAGPYPGVDSPGYPGSGWEEAFRSGETRIYRRDV